MARTQTATAQSHADREQELRHAEQELGAAESQIAQELQRLEATSGELLRRMQQLKAAAAQARLSGVREPKFAELQRRAQDADVPNLDVSGQREDALRARFEAVKARRSAVEQIQKALQAAATQMAAASTQLSADEAALTRFEAQAREEEAAKRVTLREIAHEKLPESQRETLFDAPAPRQAQTAAPAQAAASVGPPAMTAKASASQPRRALPRVRMQAAVDLHSDSNFFTGFSTNISEGGLFIATVQTVEIGTEVDLGFSLADGEKLNVQGVVRWVREVNDLTPDIFPGVGIQFVNLDPATAGAIQQFVSSREPMFFPE